MSKLLNTLNETGFVIVPEIYSKEEIRNIEHLISSVHGGKELFGERQFLQRTPGLLALLLNENMRNLLGEIAPAYFIIKSIYFDKPPQSNWFVNWHQDKILFVKEKIETYGFKNWTEKENEFGVQPTAEYLGAMITVRIHLDDTDESNGALKVIPHSHSEGIIRSAAMPIMDDHAVICNVKAGGVMLMKPLLLHASARSASEEKRRVIHLDMCNMELPEGLEWAQKIWI